MRDFQFAHPEYLLLLLALPLVEVFYRKSQKSASSLLAKFSREENLAQLIKGNSVGKNFYYFFLAGLALSLIALARPQANPIVEELQGASLDIFVLLDVSASMDAEDMAPSRLKKAKRSIQTLLDQLSGDRVGLIAFAGSAITVSPLTADYEVIKTFLQNVDSNLIQNQGTNFGNALEQAQEAMERGAERSGKNGPRTNVFILMSDGEDNEQTDLSAADMIRDKGGTIFAIAFGTEAGGTIPMRDERGFLRGQKRDPLGNTVTTKVQVKNLQEIASRGGGQFYFSTSDEQEISDILKRMQNMDRSSATLKKARIYQEYFMYPLALAFLFLAMPHWGAILGLFRKGAAVTLLFFFLMPAAHSSPLSFFWDAERKASEESKALAQEGKTEEAAARLKQLQAENPDSPELAFNMGTYLLGGGNKEEARKQLQRLGEKGGKLSNEALFNLAGSLAQDKKTEEARGVYGDVLKNLRNKKELSPEDQSLLDLTRKNLAHLAQQNKENQKQQNKDKQDQNGSGQNDKKDQKDKENSGKGDDKKDQKKEEQKKEEEKKEQEKKDQEKKDGGNEPKQMSGQKHPYKERDNMSEEDAKKVLEALKQRETNLQRKFLKEKEDGAKQPKQTGKDW